MRTTICVRYEHVRVCVSSLRKRRIRKLVQDPAVCSNIFFPHNVPNYARFSPKLCEIPELRKMIQKSRKYIDIIIILVLSRRFPSVDFIYFLNNYINNLLL